MLAQNYKSYSIEVAVPRQSQPRPLKAFQKQKCGKLPLPFGGREAHDSDIEGQKEALQGVEGFPTPTFSTHLPVLPPLCLHHLLTLAINMSNSKLVMR